MIGVAGLGLPLPEKITRARSVRHDPLKGKLLPAQVGVQIRDLLLHGCLNDGVHDNYVVPQVADCLGDEAMDTVDFLVLCGVGHLPSVNLDESVPALSRHEVVQMLLLCQHHRPLEWQSARLLSHADCVVVLVVVATSLVLVGIEGSNQLGEGRFVEFISEGVYSKIGTVSRKLTGGVTFSTRGTFKTDLSGYPYSHRIHKARSRQLGAQRAQLRIVQE
eukprot:3101404-Rhodomonas_salina.3